MGALPKGTVIAGRFLIEFLNRESLLLSGLHPPGIVAYVAHGTTEARQPYLAMNARTLALARQRWGESAA
jgi:hypothetical protein